jgi:hypothetical protein
MAMERRGAVAAPALLGLPAVPPLPDAQRAPVWDYHPPTELPPQTRAAAAGKPGAVLLRAAPATEPRVRRQPEVALGAEAEPVWEVPVAPGLPEMELRVSEHCRS